MAWEPKVNWAYIAGFFDGEGHIGDPVQPGRNALRFRVVISQNLSRSDVLYQISSFLASHNISNTIYASTSRVGSKRNPNPCMMLVIGKAKDVFRFLTAIQPYSIVKHDEIELLLEIIADRKQWAKDNQTARGSNAYRGW